MTTEALGREPTTAVRAPDRTHDMLGPYRLLQELGQGGMGVVHLALDRSGRAVAIKVLRPHVAQDPMARARLGREVDTLSRINDPGVAPVLDADIDGERPYLVTRYVPGPALVDVVEGDGPLLGPDLERLGRGLAESLQTIHSAGVIHRDLKPGNVLLLDGEPVLIDFGIAHLVDDVRLTSVGLVMGTPGYLSPEIVEGAAVTSATDWWGWAATVAFASSGRAPFGSGAMDGVLARVCRGEADLRDVDPRLAPLLASALTPDVRLRPQVQEILAALDRYRAGHATTEVMHSGRGATALLPTGLYAARAPLAPAPAPSVAPLPALTPVPPSSPSGSRLPARSAAVQALPPPPASAPAAAAAVVTGDHADPRIGRPNRTGVLVAIVTLITAAAAVAPLATAIVVGVLMVVARTSDRLVTSLVLRRHTNGVRRSDVPVAVASSPWHVVVAVLGSVLAGVVPLVVALSATFSAALAIAGLTGHSAQSAMALPCAIGGLFGTWIAWFGPAGASLRRGSRSLVRGVSGGEAMRQTLVALLLLGAAGLAAWAVVRGGQPTWWPGSQSPSMPAWLP